MSVRQSPQNSISVLWDAILLETDLVWRFFDVFHVFPQVTTRSRLPTTYMYRSTVTWRGPTVEEKEAGQGWLMSTWHNQVLRTCPQGLTQRTVSGLTLCGRSGSGCDGTMFSTLGLNYSRVCGQVRGYQQGSTDAFFPSLNSGFTVDNTFLDGVSITYGNSPRKHIWAYASGLFLSTTLNNGRYTHVIVPVIVMLIFRYLPLLVMTTIVRLVIMTILDSVALLTLSTLMTPCGMDSSVLVQRLPAAHTPTCHGSSRHSMRPPLRTLNWGCVQMIQLVMRTLQLKWSNCLCTKFMT